MNDLFQRTNFVFVPAITETTAWSISAFFIHLPSYPGLCSPSFHFLGTDPHLSAQQQPVYQLSTFDPQHDTIMEGPLLLNPVMIPITSIPIVQKTRVGESKLAHFL